MANNYRQVPGFPNYSVNPYGKVKNTKRGTNKEPSYQRPHGYLYVVLWHKGNQKKFYIHRLVYEVHVGPIAQGMEIDHIDDNPHNNHVSNLQMVTPTYNKSMRFQ